MSKVKKGIVWLLILMVIAFVLRRILAVVSINSFLFLDNLLYTGESISPWIIWAILGLLLGAVAGAMVALKKYKLAYSSVLIPLAVLVFFLAILYLVNEPANHESTRLERRTVNGTSYVHIEADGTLPDYKRTSYAPSNLLDADNNTAWLCKTGDNATISFTFSSGVSGLNNVKCIALKLKNGYDKSRKTFNDHNRMERFSLYHNNNMVGTYTANDYYNLWQEITINPIPVMPGDVLSIRIESTYTGDRYDEQTAITELFPVLEYYEK